MRLDLAVSAYVLAGGRSSRMGSDKALLELGGCPLVEHALMKLSHVTQDVALLVGAAPGNPDLEAYGRRVYDLHPDTGPLGGIEAALSDTRHDWSVIYPVDVPMVPTALLADWVDGVLSQSRSRPLRLAMFVSGGIPQPALLMIHHEMLNHVQVCIKEGKLKLYPALRWAAAQIALSIGSSVEEVILQEALDSRIEQLRKSGNWRTYFNEVQRQNVQSWFVNLNTPEDFAWAEGNQGLLDT